MITDRTGRKIKVGQVVHVMLIGMFEGKITDIKENAIQLSPNKTIYPHIAVAVPVTPVIASNGVVGDVYIIAEPDPKDPLVQEHEQRGRVIKPS